MNQAVAIGLLVVLAASTANLPFLTERVFGLLHWRGGVKPFWLRLVEVLAWYVAVGTVALAMEARLGNRHPQGWAFYAITLSLYLVMAYPGYVWCYLRRRKPAAR